MPVAMEVQGWDAKLFSQLDRSRNVVGFDGTFSLPTEHRLWLEATDAGSNKMLVKVVKHLKLDAHQAKQLYFALMNIESESPEADDKFIVEFLTKR